MIEVSYKPSEAYKIAFLTAFNYLALFIRLEASKNTLYVSYMLSWQARPS